MEIKQGKMHRGLVKVSPSTIEAEMHIKKTEHNFMAITAFKNIGFSDWSISAAFYTIYHCFLAIIVKFGYESRNQECTIAAIKELQKSKLISLSEEIIQELERIDSSHLESNIISMRENFQYGTFTNTKDNSLSRIILICRKAIDESKEIIYGSNK